MARDTDTSKLEARIVELENALKALTACRKPVDLSAEDIKAYLKVHDAIGCDVNCGNWFGACDRLCGNWSALYDFLCGNIPTRCRYGPFSKCGFPCNRCGCDIGYCGGGPTRFSELGS
jgi:hypothetical protein